MSLVLFSYILTYLKVERDFLDFLRYWCYNKTKMNRARVPRQHRRFSLPSPSALSPFGLTRSFPEGSEIFQKAFEDLCVNEPDLASGKFNNNLGFNGLTNIQEGNESDLDESVEEESPTDDAPVPSRRHSSPSCFREQFDQDLPQKSKQDQNKEKESILKTHNKLRKEYFMKHGHWPVSTSVHQSAKQRPPSYQKDKTKPNLAFGSRIPKQSSTR